MAIASGALVIVATALAGCGGDAEEKSAVTRTVRAPAPPPPPPAPTVTPVEQLMASLSIDERVVLPEGKAPDNDAERVAVLEFFDAFARGDTDTLGSMMSAFDRVELEALVEDGLWDKAVVGITEIAVETGDGPFGEHCALALFEVDGEIQPQLWYYTTEGVTARFDAVAQPPDIIDKLYGTDWITLWHELLEEEQLLANQLDIELERAPVVLAQGNRGGGGTPSGRPSNPKSPGFGPSPGGPGRTPDRRPAGKKRKPPGSR